MRITPDHPRLRIVAIFAWLFSACLIVQVALLTPANAQHVLLVAIMIAAIVLLAVGVAFWVLGTDTRAGVVFDAKGIMLNLGHSAAFVSWDQIGAVGVSRQRRSLLALGSSAQLGIKLRNPENYVQSYEVRLPASPSVFARALRWLYHLMQQNKHQDLTLAQLERLRSTTGYDILIPEAFLGGKAAHFLEILEQYRCNPQQRHSLRRTAATVLVP